MAGIPATTLAVVDENGIEPHSWFTFDELSATVSDGTVAVNKGSGAGMKLPAGSSVAVSGTDRAWQFGTTSKDTGAIDGNNLRPVTYITKINLNGQDFGSDRKTVWGCNGKAYGGLCMAVTGSGANTKVSFGPHDNGAVRTPSVDYTVPAEMLTGFHWYAVTVSSDGKALKFYLDGAEIESVSVTLTATQNGNLGWGKLGNGAGTPAGGLQVSEFRFYKQVLTEEQIAKICVSDVEVVWGTAGKAGKGVSTKNDGAFHSQTWTFNLSQDDNTVHDTLDTTRLLGIKKIRLMQRSDKTRKPSTATLTQGSVSVAATSVTSSDDTTSMTLYDSGGEVAETWACHEFVFPSDKVFDPAENIKLEFDVSTGCWVTQPPNTVMGASGWSPVIEITCACEGGAKPRQFEATLDGTKKWSELTWEPELPEDLASIDTLTINVTGTSPTLRMDAAVSLPATLVFSGGAVVVGADDALYVDGCWQIDLLKTGGITAEEGLSFPALKSGFSGAYSQSARAITLYAQNREVLSLNFANGQSVSGTGYTGLLPVQGDTWMNMTETWGSGGRTPTLPNTRVTEDGITINYREDVSGTCYAANTYGWNTASDVFLKGYLDDGGNQAQVTINNMPYSKYDVIVYCATDTGGKKFRAVTVNGTSYTYDSANPQVAKAGTANWGESQGFVAEYGKNAIRVCDQTDSTLTIKGGTNGDGARGCIAAIQIICTGTAEPLYKAYTVSINDLGKFKIPAGVDPNKIRLYDSLGNPVEITGQDETYLYYDWKYKGGIAWWDFEFEGNLKNEGSAAPGNLTWDGGSPIAQDDAYVDDGSGKQALKIPCRPYCDPSFPKTLTVVMYGKMVSSNNTVQVGIGSLTAGSQYSLFLATGDVSKNEVKLCLAHTLSEGKAATVLCEMSVPNAQTSNHLYAFVLKDDGAGHSVIDTYLDGKLLQPYTHSGTITLGSGFQVGAIHGGVGETGYLRPTKDDAAATLDVLLAYDTELNAAVMERLATEYPYVSVNGSATRSFTSGDRTWRESSAWTQTMPSGQKVLQDAPNPNTAVEVTLAGDASIEMNLGEQASYEAFSIRGDGTLTLTRGADAVTPVVTGFSTIGADMTIAYGSLQFGGNVDLAAGKTLTFDFASLDLSHYWVDTKLKLTGVVSLGAGAEVKASNIPQQEGRSVELVHDLQTGQYELVITVDTEKPFVYTANVGQPGTWTWCRRPVDEATVDAYPVFGIRKEGAGTLVKEVVVRNYVVNGGTFTVTNFVGKQSTIRVERNAILEVGAPGAEADVCALTLNGGTLRGYEAGAAFAGEITLEGDSKICSAAHADLTVGGGVTGTGAIAIFEGTVKLGQDAGLGTVGVTVMDGATLDLNGFKPGNALTISGTGAQGIGALVNTGAEVNFVGSLTLAGDATLGGAGQIGYMQGSTINLGGHTVAVKGIPLALWSLTAQGGGAVSVDDGGAFATKNQAALGDADLVIGTRGTLDLTAGVSVSCRNFTCAGSVSGDKAKLIVNGTLDATSKVTITNLKLGDGATLSGLKLVVTQQIEFGTRLNVIGTDRSRSITLAEIPDKDVTMPNTVVIDGISGYTLSRVVTQLIATNGQVVLADVTLTDLLPWVDFKSLVVSGVVSGFQGSSSGQTNINFVVTAGDGSVTTQTFAYASVDGVFTGYELVGLLPGAEYQVFAFLTIENAEVDAKSKVATVFSANTVEKWIDESAATYDVTDNKGTGQWRKTAGDVTIAGTVVNLKEARVEFYPTNATSIVVCSPIRDITVKASYDVGFTVEIGEHAGMRLSTNETGVCRFEVKRNDTWFIVDRETFAPAVSMPYEIRVRLDETNAGTATYVLVGKTGNVVLASGACEPIDDFKNLSIRFIGTGAFDALVGTCHDTNLFRQYGFGEREYPTLDAAIAACGSAGIIEPIWWSTYRLHENAGAFDYFDADGLLTILKDKWYHIAVATNASDVVTYRYCAGNNWIEYADEAGVEPRNGGWLVRSEAGLAWIAEQATNAWFAGEVTLGADLDLSSKNWTPIARFTGVFDGQGRTITGLNNTNVVTDAVLGEAGRYPDGTVNDWGYTSYGLFACATNAAFRNVTLTEVAISNTADSVAALLGVHAGGDLAVTKVTVTNGVVRGEGRAVAGLLTVGGEGEAVGSVTVTDNANYATIAGSVGDGADFGTVAQILAGTTWGTTFGTVVATDNVAQGAFDVDMSSDYEWLTLPVCNFAPVVAYADANYDFWSYVEANDPCAIPIDPETRTARMSASRFANGDVNFLGRWTDQITAVSAGTSLVITNLGAAVELDGWATVFVDRDIAIDLKDNSVYCVYDCDVFAIAAGKTLTIKGGKISVGPGCKAFGGEGTVDNQGCAIVTLAEDFEGRTITKVGEAKLAAGKMQIVLPLTSSSCTYGIETAPSLSEDWARILESEQPGNGGSLELEAPTEGRPSGFYRVYLYIDTDVN